MFKFDPSVGSTLRSQQSVGLMIGLVTNIVHTNTDSLRCGTPVRVLFEGHGEVFVPLFEPVEAARS